MPLSTAFQSAFSHSQAGVKTTSSCRESFVYCPRMGVRIAPGRGTALWATCAVAIAGLVGASGATAAFSVDTGYGGDATAETIFDGYTASNEAIGTYGSAAVVAATLFDGSTTRVGVMRLDGYGLPDEDFDSNGRVILPPGGELALLDGMAVAPSGHVYVLTSAGGISPSGSSLVRFDRDGAFDSRFGGDGTFELSFGASSRGLGADVAVANDGRVLVAGTVDSPVPGNGRDLSLLRIANGELDSSFGNGGRVIAGTTDDERANSVAALVEDGACVLGQASGYVTRMCVDGLGSITEAPQGSGAPGLVQFGGDVAGLQSGGHATSFTQNARGRAQTAIGSSQLTQPWTFPSADPSPSSARAEAIDDAGGRGIVLVGSADAGTSSLDAPVWLRLDPTSERPEPGEVLRVTEGLGGATEATDVAIDDNGKALTTVRHGDVLAVARILLDDPRPIDPRDPDRLELRLGRLRVPDTLGGLLRRGTRFSALCTTDCTLRTKLVISKRAARQLGLHDRVVDRFHGGLEGGVKYLVRMPFRAGAGRKARSAGIDPRDLGLKVRSRASR